MSIDETIKVVIANMPNFLGLIFCISILYTINRDLRAQNNYLTNVIIRGANCKETDADDLLPDHISS